MRHLALLALPLAACLPSTGDGGRSLAGLGIARDAIVGGSKDTSDTSVVLVMGQRPGSTDAALCTGTVISPHVVLTAAHCVDPSVVGTGLAFSIFLGNDLHAQLNDSSLWVDAASTDYDHDFNLQDVTAGHDIAVVVTATKLLQPPILVNQDALAPGDKNTTLRIIGFGTTSIAAGTDDSGIRRQASTPLLDYDDQFVQFGDAMHNTCEGDSGGPSLMTRNGKEYIVGVTSFGDSNCQVGGWDTRVDTYVSSFIAPHVMTVDGMLPGDPQPTTDGSVGPDGGMDMAGVNPTGGGDVGAMCTTGSDCASGICTTGNKTYCTQACDPQKAGACPEGSQCSLLGGANYCTIADHGCSASAGSLQGSLGPLLLLGLFLLGFLVRRRVA